MTRKGINNPTDGSTNRRDYMPGRIEIQTLDVTLDVTGSRQAVSRISQTSAVYAVAD